jgi:hypothetical protein
MTAGAGSLYKKNPDIVCRRVATEIILVPIRNNVREVGLYSLNEVAAFVWDRLDGKHTLADLAREVVDEFDVDDSKARGDIETLLAKLSKMGGIHEA